MTDNTRDALVTMRAKLAKEHGEITAALAQLTTAMDMQRTTLVRTEGAIAILDKMIDETAPGYEPDMLADLKLNGAGMQVGINVPADGNQA